MAYLGADKLIFEEKWPEFDRLVTGKRQQPDHAGCVMNGVRFALESQLGLGRIAPFFRAADKVTAHAELAPLLPVMIADYIQLQRADQKAPPRVQAEKRRNLFAVMTELQDREPLLKAVQRALAPKLLFAIAARTMVEKVNGRLLRAEAQGAPVLVLRTPQGPDKFGYQVMVAYDAPGKPEIIAGGPKAIILDALKRHDGAPGRTIAEAAAVVIRMRQGFWDIARQVAKAPAQRESALQQFDATQTLVRTHHILAGNFPDIRLQFVSASALARSKARLARNQAKVAQQPQNIALAKSNETAAQRIAKTGQALVLIDRLHALRSALSTDPRARSMHNSRLQLKQRLAAKSVPR